MSTLSINLYSYRDKKTPAEKLKKNDNQCMVDCRTC